jgi:hypothetical protein
MPNGWFAVLPAGTAPGATATALGSRARVTDTPDGVAVSVPTTPLEELRGRLRELLPRPAAVTIYPADTEPESPA